MDVSVVICTYNRCESLRRTLDGFCRLQIPQQLDWELIVVDNNSTDGTKSVCETFVQRLPLRYIFEPVQGQSRARNRGIQESQGALLLFTDDDVDADSQWLAQLWRASQNQSAAFFGGRIIPKWEGHPARWLRAHSKSLLPGVTLHFDRGDSERFLQQGENPFFGANMAFRRDVFQDDLRFREDLGLSEGHQIRGEEFELMARLMGMGHKGFYVPSAVVGHRNSRRRMTETYVREWFVGAGITEARNGDFRTSRLWGHVPRWCWKRLVVSTLKYLATRLICRSHVWLPAEIGMAKSWGMAKELMRIRGQHSKNLSVNQP